MGDADAELEGLADGSVWAEFCDLLGQASDLLRRDDLGLDDFDRAEGHRYLARLLQNGLATFLEDQGPRHPQVRSLPAHCGFGLDNPDNVYSSFGVDARLTYRITGTRGTIAYLSFGAQNQNYAAKDRITGGAGHLNASDLVLGPNGEFDIVASVEEPLGHTGNWLRLAPDTSMVLIRQTFADRATETAAAVGVECVDVDEPSPALDAESVQRRLLSAVMYTIGASVWFADWVAPWRAEPNRLHFPDEEHHRLVGGDPDIVFQLGYWSLGPDEALVIDHEPPECGYWNFQLGNIWAECLDKRRSISRNHLTAVPEAAPSGVGASVRLVVAHRDPGHSNWLDTCGHAHGIMGLRQVLAKSHPAARTRVVPVDEVGAT